MRVSTLYTFYAAGLVLFIFFRDQCYTAYCASVVGCSTTSRRAGRIGRPAFLYPGVTQCTHFMTCGDHIYWYMGARPEGGGSAGVRYPPPYTPARTTQGAPAHEKPRTLSLCTFTNKCYTLLHLYLRHTLVHRVLQCNTMCTL